jgi:hypothetical protein
VQAQKTCEVLTAEQAVVQQLLCIFKADGGRIKQQSLKAHTAIMQQCGKRFRVATADIASAATAAALRPWPYGMPKRQLLCAGTEDV